MVLLQEAMKNAKELIEEEERDRKKAEKRRAKKKVCFSRRALTCTRNYEKRIFVPSQTLG